MSIQKFSKFVTEASAADAVAPKDDDDEVKGYKPRAKGEEDFANQHMVQKTDYLAAPGQDHVFNGTIKEGLEDNTENPANRQHLCAKNVVHEQFGEGVCISEEHADPDENGHVEWYDVMFKHGLERQVPVAEMKVTKAESHLHASKKSKKKIDEEVDLIEGKVMDALQKIVKDKSAGKVKFANGKTLQVDMTTANAMLNLHKKINDKNKAKMEDQIEKSPDVFMKLMDVAFGGK
jgi:hypothetical protein